MEFVQDKCDLLDSFKVGDMISVEYNLKGRKWTNLKGEDVYFNTIQAWKISAVGGQAVNSAVSDAVEASMDDDLGLPF